MAKEVEEDDGEDEVRLDQLLQMLSNVSQKESVAFRSPEVMKL